MAVNLRQFFPLRQAKAHRVQMPRYLELDGGRYLIAAALLLSLISLLTLLQTGRLAEKGFALAQLQGQRTALLRERSALQMQLSESRSLGEVRRHAEQLGLRPMQPDQVRYMPMAERPQPAAPPASPPDTPALTPDGDGAAE